MDAAERASHAGDITLEDLDHGSITLTGATLTLTGEIDNVLVSRWMARKTPASAVDTVDTRAVDYFGTPA